MSNTVYGCFASALFPNFWSRLTYVFDQFPQLLSPGQWLRERIIYMRSIPTRIDPSMVFFKFWQRPVCEYPSALPKRVPFKIRNLAKFKGNTSKASKDVAAQGRRVFSTDIVCVLHHTNVFEIPPICGVISSLVLNKALSNRFRGILPAVLTGGFSLTGSSQKLEEPISSLSMSPSTSNILYW